MIEQIHVSFKRRPEKYALAVLCQQQNVTRISPVSYVHACTHIRLCILLESGKVHSFFCFLKAFFSLNRDKYFALYWCFCVRISFILLLITWSEMDPNGEPQTLIETFVQANSNSITEYICQHAQLSLASAVWRDCKLLYEGPWQKRDWVPLQFCIWAQWRNWYWWHYNRVCLSEGYTFRPLLVTSLMASLFYSFLP